MPERICERCGEPCGARAVDYSYRIGDTEEIVERWVCHLCDQDMYDEAISHMGDY